MWKTVAEELEAMREAIGLIQGTREALEIVLTARFGEVSKEVRKVIATSDIKTCQGWLARAATAETLEEVGIAGETS